MRLRLIAVVWVALASPAIADTGSGSDDTPTADDIRDVLSGERAQNVRASDDEKPAEASDEEPATGTVRGGGYFDTDGTRVLRTVGILGKGFGRWHVDGTFTVDAVTSASIDVRTSPALSKVDTVTSASGISTTTGGQMHDTRYQGTGGLGWKDSAGHAVNATAAIAKETDYASVSGGLNGSYDVFDRNVTLLGGVTVTDNWVSSVLDSSFHGKMFAVGWSAGIARVLTRDDALRLRYDGKASEGYQGSPYRNVRFGNWSTMTNADHQVLFSNTIGSADGLAERVPQSRISHALTLEWVHSLAMGIGLHSSVRAARDSWGVMGTTAALDLRIAHPSWRLDAGYRFYRQWGADFFEGKYVNDPSMYRYYTSDKELGQQVGHLVTFDVARVLIDKEQESDSRLLFDLHLDLAHYDYPGFLLLSDRSSAFIEAGLIWEL
jgi:hypothetical protein